MSGIYTQLFENKKRKHNNYFGFRFFGFLGFRAKRVFKTGFRVFLFQPNGVSLVKRFFNSRFETA